MYFSSIGEFSSSFGGSSPSTNLTSVGSAPSFGGFTNNNKNPKQERKSYNTGIAPSNPRSYIDSKGVAYMQQSLEGKSRENSMVVSEGEGGDLHLKMKEGKLDDLYDDEEESMKEKCQKEEEETVKDEGDSEGYWDPFIDSLIP